MKIATYNINGINGRIDLLVRWLKEAQPDVVCLQELKCAQNDFPETKLLAAGFHAIWQGQKSWNGVAIIEFVFAVELLNKFEKVINVFS